MVRLASEGVDDRGLRHGVVFGTVVSKQVVNDAGGGPPRDSLWIG